MRKPKLVVIGHGRHGKDTVCEILKDSFGYSFKSSSQFCNDLFIYDKLKEKHGYKSKFECYADRHNHRSEWFDLICDYNKKDKARLGRNILNNFDIYCGSRNEEELNAMKNEGIYDFSIWVDRSKVLPLEPRSSFNLYKFDSDFIVDNNSDLKTLKNTVSILIKYIEFKFNS
jgi:hypothetical protein